MTDFPFAPENWKETDAERVARNEGIALGPDHKMLLRAVQEYFARHDKPDVGTKYLFRLFPGGPIAQGCRLAGLPVPAGAVDKSFGSTQ